MASQPGNQPDPANQVNAGNTEAKAENTDNVEKKGDTKRKSFVIQPKENWASYVPQDHRDKATETNLFESVAHLVKGCLGAGILGMPFGFKLTGLWTAFFTNIISAFLVAYGIQQLIDSAHIMCPRCQVASMTYSDLAEASFATAPCAWLRNKDFTFRIIVDTIIAVNLFASCCVYLIVIAATIKQVFEAWGLDMSIRVYIVLLFPLLTALCMIRSLKYLAPFSAVANVFVVVCVFTTVYYGFKNQIPLSELPSWQGFLPFMAFIGISVFSVEGIGVALAIENQMRKPKDFLLANVIAYTIVLILVNLTGFFGYWGYGNECKGSILLNFPSTSFLILIKLMLAFVMFVTFAVNFWVPFNVTWFYLKDKFDPTKQPIGEKIMRAVWVFVITVIAFAVPTIGSFIGLIGAFCLSMMSFLFVPIIELAVIWQNPGLGPGKIHLWKNILLILFSILLFGLGTYQNLVDMIKETDD